MLTADCDCKKSSGKGVFGLEICKSGGYNVGLSGIFQVESPETGALAQLGERLHGMQEVESSILLGSIRKAL